MMINSKECKNALTISKLPEVDYCLNPYVGCMHGCVYCYATFMRRFTGHASDKWGEFLDIKSNIVEILEKDIKKYKGGTILLGSVTDCYQPCESKYLLTRNLLIKLQKYNLPISILTKSKLVIRDIDILKNFDNCEVGLTITTLDPVFSKIIEPKASLPFERLNALKELKKHGIKTYAFIGPIFPMQTNLEEIFCALSEINVDYVMAEVLNLKCGTGQEVKEKLKDYPKIQDIFCNSGYEKYMRQTQKQVNELSKKYNISLKGFYNH